MTKEEIQQRFTDLSLLFLHPGWKHFIDDFTGMKDALVKDAYSQRSLEDYFFAKGRMDCFTQVLAYEELIKGDENALDQQAASDEETTAEE